MAIGFDGPAPRKATKKSGKRTEEPGNGLTYLTPTDQLGQYVYTQNKKRVMVVPLFCDCGRSILVSPKEIRDAPIICSLCNSSFSWQQLTLALD